METHRVTANTRVGLAWPKPNANMGEKRGGYTSYYFKREFQATHQVTKYLMNCLSSGRLLDLSVGNVPFIQLSEEIYDHMAKSRDWHDDGGN